MVLGFSTISLASRRITVTFHFFTNGREPCVRLCYAALIIKGSGDDQSEGDHGERQPVGRDSPTHVASLQTRKDLRRYQATLAEAALPGLVVEWTKRIRLLSIKPAARG